MKLLILFLIVVLFIAVQNRPQPSNSTEPGRALTGSLGGGGAERGGIKGETGKGVEGPASPENPALKDQWKSKPQTGE